MSSDDFIARPCLFDETDLDCLNRLERESHRYYAFTDPDKPRHNKEDNSYVMMVDDKVTGRKGIATCSASWKPMWAGGKMRQCGEIWRLRVDSSYRRRRLGSFLVKEMEKALAERGIELIYIVIWSPNPGSEGLFAGAMKYQKIYKADMRMITIDPIANAPAPTLASQVKCIDKPYDILGEKYSRCFLWPQDPSVLKVKLYEIELPGNRGKVSSLVWDHCYPIGIRITDYYEQLTVYVRRFGRLFVPSMFEKPIGLHEKFVMRFMYPIRTPENATPAEVADYVAALLHKIATISKADGADYLVVPLALSQLSDEMIQSGVLPFANLLSDLAHSLYVKPINPDENFARLLAEEAKGIVFTNAEEL